MLGDELSTLMSEDGAREVCELLWVRVTQLVGGPSRRALTQPSFQAALLQTSSCQAFFCLHPLPTPQGWGLLTSGVGGLHGTDLSLKHLPGGRWCSDHRILSL